MFNRLCWVIVRTKLKLFLALLCNLTEVTFGGCSFTVKCKLNVQRYFRSIFLQKRHNVFSELLNHMKIIMVQTFLLADNKIPFFICLQRNEFPSLSWPLRTWLWSHQDVMCLLTVPVAIET